jgi:hypothetical protein
MAMKTSNVIIGNRTHNLPACSEVAQPAALSRASNKIHGLRKSLKKNGEKSKKNNGMFAV